METHRGTRARNGNNAEKPATHAAEEKRSNLRRKRNGAKPGSASAGIEKEAEQIEGVPIVSSAQESIREGCPPIENKGGNGGSTQQLTTQPPSRKGGMKRGGLRRRLVGSRKIAQKNRLSLGKGEGEAKGWALVWIAQVRTNDTSQSTLLNAEIKYLGSGRHKRQDTRAMSRNLGKYSPGDRRKERT